MGFIKIINTDDASANTLREEEGRLLREREIKHARGLEIEKRDETRKLRYASRDLVYTERTMQFP